MKLFVSYFYIGENNAIGFGNTEVTVIGTGILSILQIRGMESQIEESVKHKVVLVSWNYFDKGE